MNLNRRKNIRVVAALIGAMGVMTGLVAYSPTLYRLFYAATGYGGTTQRAEGSDGASSDRIVTVRFDANTAPDLPWRFEPVQRAVKVHLGEEKLIFYTAENLADLWATWCVPCRKEMPALDRLQAMLGGPDFEVVALSIDRQGISVVRPFYEQLGIKALGIYIDQSGKAAQLLQTVGVPTTLLIDGEGREIARKMGAIEWNSPAMIELIRQHLAAPADTRARMSSKVNR